MGGLFTAIIVLVLLIVYICLVTTQRAGYTSGINGGLLESPPPVYKYDGINEDLTATNATTDIYNFANHGPPAGDIFATSVDADGQNPKFCTINLNDDLSNQSPLILNNGGTNDGLGFQLPDSNSNLTFAAGDQVCFSCPGPNNYFLPLRSGTRDIQAQVQATCVDGTIFDFSGTNCDISKLKCKQNPVPAAVRSESSCNDGNSLIYNGFKTESGFIKNFTVCFSDDNLETLWSKFDLVSSIDGKQVGPRNSSFVAADFYPGLNPSRCYTKVAQRASFARLLGSNELANELISTTTDYYLAKGHLTAYADFVYASQQRATSYYINVAPQWQTFNNGNWRTLEDNVRKLVATRPGLEVYTGTSGIVTFANTDGVQTQMYLYQDKNGRNQIPVPAVFWKIVYDPRTQKGTAMVGINNPYFTKAQVVASSLYWLCDDVSSEISWVKWDKDNQKKGIGYCCDVNQLRSKVPSIPSFPVTGLLV